MAKEFDWHHEAQDVLRGLEQAEQQKPTTSLLFKRTKRLLHGLLGKVPGYGVLLQFWQAVQALRHHAHHDPKIGSAHIIVRIPGREKEGAVYMRFELLDDVSHGK